MRTSSFSVAPIVKRKIEAVWDTHRNLISVIAIFFIVLGALLFRRYDAFTYPQLWAEDGTIFLQQYQDLGIRSLVTPYNGYFHLLPRLISFFFGSLSISYLYIPACYNAVAFVITFLVAIQLWRSAVYSNLRYKILYATFFLFLPISGDPYMNVTNIIWLGALYLVDFLLIGHKHGNKYLNSIIIFIFSLTGPFSLLLAPVVVLIFIVERREMSMPKTIPLIIILAGGIIQLACIKLTGNIHRGVFADPPEHLHSIKVIVNNISDLLFMRIGSMSTLLEKLQFFVCCVVFCILLYAIAVKYRRMNYERKYILLMIPVIFFGSYVLAWWPNESKVLALGGGARYYIIPYACIAWIFTLSGRTKITLFGFSVYAILFLLQWQHVKLILPDREWKQQILEYDEGKSDTISINPGGWFFIPRKKI